MTEFARLYEDVLAAGGLAPRLLDVLGDRFVADAEDPLAAVLSRVDGGTADEPDLLGRHWRVAITVGLEQRMFHLNLFPPALSLAFASGWVLSLDDVARILVALTETPDVRWVVDAEPLLDWTQDGAAFVSGDEAEWHWQDLLARGAPELTAVIHAAAAEPRLRALRPYTSMYSLCFSRVTRYPFSDAGPFIQATFPGFEVTARRDQRRGERVDDPVAAAACAAALVPPGTVAVA